MAPLFDAGQKPTKKKGEVFMAAIRPGLGTATVTMFSKKPPSERLDLSASSPFAEKFNFKPQTIIFHNRTEPEAELPHFFHINKCIIKYL